MWNIKINFKMFFKLHLSKQLYWIAKTRYQKITRLLIKTRKGVIKEVRVLKTKIKTKCRKIGQQKLAQSLNKNWWGVLVFNWSFLFFLQEGVLFVRHFDLKVKVRKAVMANKFLLCKTWAWQNSRQATPTDAQMKNEEETGKHTLLCQCHITPEVLWAHPKGTAEKSSGPSQQQRT